MATKTKALMKEGESLLMSEETTMFLLDVSGSMGQDMTKGDFYSGEGNENSKIAALKKAILAALEERIKHPSNDRLGVITFGGTDWGEEGNHGVKVVLQPSCTSAAHASEVGRLQSAGGTPMYSAFQKAKDLLKKVEGFIRIILVTDGCPTGRHGKDEIKRLVKTLAEEEGFVVDCVGVGTPKCCEYDERFLKELAKMGEGQFYPVEDAQALINRFLEIERERRALIGGGIKLLAATYE